MIIIGFRYTVWNAPCIFEEQESPGETSERGEEGKRSHPAKSKKYRDGEEFPLILQFGIQGLLTCLILY